MASGLGRAQALFDSRLEYLALASVNL